MHLSTSYVPAVKRNLILVFTGWLGRAWLMRQGALLFSLLPSLWLWAQGSPRKLTTLADTATGEAPLYQMGLFPWHDPLDTVIAFAARQGYYKPYTLWRDGAFQYDDFAALPFQQGVYLITEAPLIWSRKPYTRVRFDQSSRKTQLLSVRHGQTFRRGAGVSFSYQRRTRTGEYIGQTTDHYGTALTVYMPLGRWLWGRLAGGWNQLQDGINGGVLFTESPVDGFQKERQLVRTNGAQLRRWYRFAEAEIGLHLSQRAGIALRSRLTEDRVETKAPSALRSESPLYSDTLSTELGIHQTRKQAGLFLWTKPWQMEVSYTEHLGRGDAFWFAGWRLSSVEAHTVLRFGALTMQGHYRQWIGANVPSPAYRMELRWKPQRYEVGISHLSRNLPWIAYQGRILAGRPANEVLTHAWASVELPPSDTTLPPLRAQVWGMHWQQPWLMDSTFTQRAPILTAGLKVQGGWQGRIGGVLTGLTVQHLLSAPSDWRRVIPRAFGWVQPFLRWQLRKAPPVYQFGIRFSGFTVFQPMAYEVLLGAYYRNPLYTGYEQRAYVWADPYFVVLIRRVMVYLRVEHVTEGLIAPGYYLAAWYPMPGRAFSFGVQWDIYN